METARETTTPQDDADAFNEHHTDTAPGDLRPLTQLENIEDHLDHEYSASRGGHR